MRERKNERMSEGKRATEKSVKASLNFLAGKTHRAAEREAHKSRRRYDCVAKCLSLVAQPFVEQIGVCLFFAGVFLF